MQFLRDAPGLNNPIALAAGAATAMAAGAYLLTSKPQKYVTPVDMKNQSIELPDGSRTSVFAPTGELIEYLFEDARTTHECFKRGLKVSRNRPCLGSRPGPNKEYEWTTYQQLYQRICAFGSGLVLEGLKPGTSTFVGIYSGNNTQWVIAEQACSMFSMVTVALYDTLGPNTCKYIINQTEMTVVICDKAEKAQVLLDEAEELTSLKTIILMGEISDKNVETAAQFGIKLLRFSDIEETGKGNIQDPVPPKSSDLATICYTSGTTGDPKGAMMTHANLISNLGSILHYIGKCNVNLTHEDIHLSYLPLAHVFERGMQIVFFMIGARIGFFSGDLKLLTDDMKALKPTVFGTVPRLLNRMYDKVCQGVKSSPLKAKMMELAMASKEKELEQYIIRKDSIWDWLVFSKIQALLGGQVKLVFTASAPLGVKVLNFTRCAFGCVVVEGYGQTESSAGIAFNIPGEYEAGHVGPPLPCNIVKLVDVPDMEYFAKDGKGEVCCKGPNVFSGYYKNAEKTAEALDQDGWLHTGDVGQWLPNGCLKIIDRKKNIFKLAQGEYVAAEKIENTYMRSEYVAQAFVEGDSLRSCLMGVMVPDEEVMMAWAKQQKSPDSFMELCCREDVKNMILKDINKIGKQAGLKGFEMVRDIYLCDEQFSVENDLLTPTFKNKRPALRKYFKDNVEKMYALHGE